MSWNDISSSTLDNFERFLDVVSEDLCSLGLNVVSEGNPCKNEDARAEFCGASCSSPFLVLLRTFWTSRLEGEVFFTSLSLVAVRSLLFFSVNSLRKLNKLITGLYNTPIGARNESILPSIWANSVKKDSYDNGLRAMQVRSKFSNLIVGSVNVSNVFVP